MQDSKPEKVVEMLNGVKQEVILCIFYLFFF